MIVCALDEYGEPVKLNGVQLKDFDEMALASEKRRLACKLSGGHIKGQQVRQEQKWLCANCNVVIYG